MSCGVCNPKAFRPKAGTRVFGYLTATNMTHAATGARPLYFMGCESVFCDVPVGPVASRTGYKWLLLCIRPGDRIIVADIKVLGSSHRTQQTRMAEIEANGGNAFVLTDQKQEIWDPTLMMGHRAATQSDHQTSPAD